MSSKLILQTFNETDLMLKVINLLCDARNEPKIPIIYHYDNDIGFEIKNIYEKDNDRFSIILGIIWNYPNIVERARKGCKTIITKKVNLFKEG